MRALGRLDTAWTALNDSLPGFRADTLPEGKGSSEDTQPERMAIPGVVKDEKGVEHETPSPYTRDPAMHDLLELAIHSKRLYVEATIVGDILARWSRGTRKGTADEGKANAGDWCSNHLHVGLIEPRHRGDLCRWCYDFNANEATLPPASLLRERHGGRRITQDMVKAAIGTRSKRKNLKRAKARRRRKAA